MIDVQIAVPMRRNSAAMMDITVEIRKRSAFLITPL